MAIIDRTKYNSGYENILRTDFRQAVIEKMGKPTRLMGPPEKVAWDTPASIRQNGGECTSVFVYEPPLDIDGSHWDIGFDAGGHVVSKYHHVSP